MQETCGRDLSCWRGSWVAGFCLVWVAGYKRPAIVTGELFLGRVLCFTIVSFCSDVSQLGVSLCLLSGILSWVYVHRMAEAAEKLAKIPAWNKPGVFNLDISEECPTRKFKELVRQGIPTKLRPGLWLQLSGGLAMKKAAPADYFLNLAAFPGVMDPSAVRGFAHPQLTSQKGLSAVRRVVLAYGHHRGKGEISTNVTQLAAFLLAIFGLEKLEDVFWTLVGLENKLKPFSFCEVFRCPSPVILCLSAGNFSAHIGSEVNFAKKVCCGRLLGAKVSVCSLCWRFLVEVQG